MGCFRIGAYCQKLNHDRMAENGIIEHLHMLSIAYIIRQQTTEAAFEMVAIDNNQYSNWYLSDIHKIIHRSKFCLWQSQIISTRGIELSYFVLALLELENIQYLFINVMVPQIKHQFLEGYESTECCFS